MLRSRATSQLKAFPRTQSFSARGMNRSYGEKAGEDTTDSLCSGLARTTTNLGRSRQRRVKSVTNCAFEKLQPTAKGRHSRPGTDRRGSKILL